jgi:hypothetical protein
MRKIEGGKMLSHMPKLDQSSEKFETSASCNSATRVTGEFFWTDIVVGKTNRDQFGWIQLPGCLHPHQFGK